MDYILTDFILLGDLASEWEPLVGLGFNLPTSAMRPIWQWPEMLPSRNFTTRDNVHTPSNFRSSAYGKLILPNSCRKKTDASSEKSSANAESRKPSVCLHENPTKAIGGETRRMEMVRVNKRRAEVKAKTSPRTVSGKRATAGKTRPPTGTTDGGGGGIRVGKRRRKANRRRTFGQETSGTA